MSWLPLYHDMGLIGFVLAPLYHRVPVALPAGAALPQAPGHAGSRRSPAHGGTIAYAPNFAYALCVKRIKAAELEGIDLSRWRVAGCGAEPIRPETLEAFATTFARDRLQQGGAPAVLRHGRVVARHLVHRARRGDEDDRRRRPDALGRRARRSIVPDDARGRRARSSRAGASSPITRSRVFAPDDASSEHAPPRAARSARSASRARA